MTDQYASGSGTRPDPLAIDFWDRQAADSGDPPDLSICAKMDARTEVHCAAPPVRIIWIGCINEHVGPVAACVPHALEILRVAGMLTCGVCGCQTVIIKTEDIVTEDDDDGLVG